MTKRYKVYLSGPIEGIPEDVANHWRDQVELSLPVDVFECLNPMSWASATDTPEEYFRKDVEQLEQTDILLVNVQDEPSHIICERRDHGEVYGPMRGTTWEVGWAYTRKLPIYVVYKDEAQRDRLGPFIREPVRALWWPINTFDGLDGMESLLNVIQSDAAIGAFDEPDQH